MKLRGIEFGSVIGASGVQGFFGEGYPYHRYLETFPGFRFGRMTFTAKTVTLNAHEGNMPLKEDGLTPREFRPKCIYVSPRSFVRGAALNAVGLSNFGARFYLETGRWQEREDAFFISFMSLKATREERLQELKDFVKLLSGYMGMFSGSVGLQINLSCPNVGLHFGELVEEALEMLEAASCLGIPLVIKLNILVSIEAARRIAEHRCCDALCLSNTIPWGKLPEKIDWKKLFGTDESPLKHLGGGGLSGAPLLPLLIEWLDLARGVVSKPIIAGGGILGPDDVKLLSYTHPAAISLGSIVMLRPWRLAATIEEGHKLF